MLFNTSYFFIWVKSKITKPFDDQTCLRWRTTKNFFPHDDQTYFRRYSFISSINLRIWFSRSCLSRSVSSLIFWACCNFLLLLILIHSLFRAVNYKLKSKRNSPISFLKELCSSLTFFTSRIFFEQYLKFRFIHTSYTQRIFSPTTTEQF